RVLRNQVQFLDPLGEQRPRLGNNVRLLPAPMGAAHPGYDAKTARMVASFGDLDVSEVARSQAEPRCVIVRDVARAEVDFDKRGGGGVAQFAKLLFRRLGIGTSHVACGVSRMPRGVSRVVRGVIADSGWIFGRF